MKFVTLESKYRNAIYADINLVFRNGRARVKEEDMADLQEYPCYGREFARLGELSDPAKFERVHVIRGKSESSTPADSHKDHPELVHEPPVEKAPEPAPLRKRNTSKGA